MAQYVIGVDFGSLSGRAVLVDSRTGQIAAQRTVPYAHGVMTEGGAGWALHHPADYLDVLETAVPQVLRDASVTAEQVTAIGWDVTACTMLPVQADGTPLCMLPEYQKTPHAYMKLWKHLAAEGQARRVEAAIREFDPQLLADYGGHVASQWMLPKILQIAEEAPEVYQRADYLVEASDWLVLALTGDLVRSRCFAGFKNFYDPARGGYLPAPLLKSLHPLFEDLTAEKLRGEIAAPWECAGTLTPEWAGRLGLCAGTVVAVGIIDAHAGLPGSGVTEPGTMLMAIGTSTCHMLLSGEKHPMPGICGVVGNSVLPGLYTYEAGQACVGDLLDWFVKEAVPARETEAAEAAGESIHAYLCREAAQLPPGSGGLMALDWWNGQRSPYVDDRLSGMMLGLTIRTTPAQQYRALMEATAYGSRLILDTFEAGGVPVRQIVACGGIPHKNPLMMQIYADVLGRPIQTVRETETTALGAAVMAAAAAGIYETPEEAVGCMTGGRGTVYTPDPQRAAIYRELYREYRQLAAYFASENPVMHHLRTLSAPADMSRSDEQEK